MQRLTTILLIVLLCLVALSATHPASAASPPLLRANGGVPVTADFSATSMALDGIPGIRIAVPQGAPGAAQESTAPQPTATPDAATPDAAMPEAATPAATAVPTTTTLPVTTTAPLQETPGAAGAMILALVTVDEAVVYSGPGPAYRKMGTLAQGTEVTIVGRNPNCAWLQATGELPGWIARASLFLGGECTVLSETASLPPTPLPTRTITARVIGNDVSVKAGPGHGYAQLTILPADTVVTLTKRDASCTWLLAEGAVTGWIKIHSLVLNDGCNFLPAVPDAIPALAITPAATTPAATTPAATTPAATTPAATTPAVTTPAAATAPAPTPTARPSPTATWVPGTPQVLSDFETLGTWRRGDETWGTLQASAAQAVSGNGSALLDYTIPANVTNNYVVFLRAIPMAGTPNRLSLQVYGDGSGNFLNLWVLDASDQVWQFHFGAVDHTGWQKMEAVLDTSLPWPTSLISGSETEKRLDYPISFAALVLDQPGNVLSVGKIYLDDLTAFTE